MRPNKTSANAVASAQPNSEALVTDLRELILSARQTVARGVNATLVLLYWKVGQRIRQDVLREKWAEYGQEIFSTLSGKLVVEFGWGFSQQNLFNMLRLAEVFPDSRIFQSLIGKLSWTHFLHIIRLDDPLIDQHTAQQQARAKPCADASAQS